MTDPTTASHDALAEELRNVVMQAEALLNALGVDSDAALGSMRQRVYDSIDTAKTRLADIEEQALRARQHATLAIEEWVRANPWTAVAIGAGLGMVIASLLMRNGREAPRRREPDAQ
jgi:ElaB/YqjD/DUF883 family membrane-anchored ribosome-binding protein